ncbi:MAG: dUTP diphosphatase [Nanoarchaeota archaeon]|nr:dUTP diphosphatase [Nanoarchaeota archaeon]MBU1030943.1 dUTP diphosphatase [Nanoarchaeota archaeon]MBU1850011.1 dUTP diphosphatase [Nanoarchaeota archaeon]
MVRVNVKLRVGFEDFLPVYGTIGAAAADLLAAVNESVVLKSGESKLIPTGIHIELPENFMMHITPRSGFALKHGISIVNSPGIVDSDYRGEVGVILINHGKEDFVVERGDRVAQATIIKAERAEFEIVNELSDTERSYGGFGHTGKK